MDGLTNRSTQVEAGWRSGWRTRATGSSCRLPAPAGPSGRSRHYAPDELVRFDARIPARLAKQLYDVALTDGRSVTAVHADLLAAALECRGAAMD
jgi:hypothetical protein